MAEKCSVFENNLAEKVPEIQERKHRSRQGQKPRPQTCETKVVNF